MWHILPIFKIGLIINVKSSQILTFFLTGTSGELPTHCDLPHLSFFHSFILPVLVQLLTWKHMEFGWHLSSSLEYLLICLDWYQKWKHAFPEVLLSVFCSIHIILLYYIIITIQDYLEYSKLYILNYSITNYIL